MVRDGAHGALNDVPVAEPTIAVIGAGAWGTTLASILSSRAPTTIWARETAVADSINSQRRNDRFLPGYPLPAELEATDRLDVALARASVVILAVPAQHLRNVVRAAHRRVWTSALVVSATKGLELQTGLRMSEVIIDELPRHDPRLVGVISGPNLAREIMAGERAATCVAFADGRSAATVQGLLAGDRLRVYTSDDVIGCEVAGAVKNVIAIAAGVAAGLGYGQNTMAALITRGLAEITRLGVALGGRPLTFLGLAGTGDLVATCASPLSRNHRVGEQLAGGLRLEDITRAGDSVAEGVETAPAVVRVAARAGVEMPICAGVLAVLTGASSPSEVVSTLMRRSPTAELREPEVSVRLEHR